MKARQGYRDQCLTLAVTLLAVGCPKAQEVATTRPASELSTFRETGTASWYGPGFHGRQTASGERYDQNEMTAAHRSLPLGTSVEVTNVDSGKSVRVVINDRGPYVDGRIIDLSRAAAEQLDLRHQGLGEVTIEARQTQEDSVSTH